MTVARKIPFPVVGYALILGGFVSMGLFVFALGSSASAPLVTAAGICMVIAFLGAFTSFGTGIVLSRKFNDAGLGHYSSDPLVPAEDQARIDTYLATYRASSAAAEEPARDGAEHASPLLAA